MQSSTVATQLKVFLTLSQNWNVHENKVLVSLKIAPSNGKMSVKLISVGNNYCQYLIIFHLLVLIIPQVVQSADWDGSYIDKPTLVVDYGFGNDKTHFNSRENISQRIQHIVLNSTGREISIECRAPYPVDLSFFGYQSNRDFETIASKQGETFFIKAITPGFESATGYYSCFSVQYPKQSSSLYIYITPTTPSLLVNRGRTIVVQADFNRSRIVIPCPSSNPSGCGMIRLQKYADRSGIWEDVSNPITCNSKFGFLIENVFGSAGVYKCTGITSTDEVVVIVEHRRQFQPRSLKYQTSKISQFIQACGTQNKGTVKFFKCYSWTNCLMRRCQRYDYNCENDDDFQNGQGGIVQCMSNFTEPVSMIYFKGLTSNSIITDWRKSPKNDRFILNVQIPNQAGGNNPRTSSELTGNTYKFVCEGTKFVFAHNFQWTMVVAQQTTTEVLYIPAEDVKHVNSLRGQSIISSELTLRGLPPNFVGISCEARIWNSTETETVKMSRQEVRKVIAIQQLNINRHRGGFIHYSQNVAQLYKPYRQKHAQRNLQNPDPFTY